MYASIRVFKLLTKLSSKWTMEFRYLKINKLSLLIKPIKQLRLFLNEKNTAHWAVLLLAVVYIKYVDLKDGVYVQ